MKLHLRKYDPLAAGAQAETLCGLKRAPVSIHTDGNRPINCKTCRRLSKKR